MQNKTKKIIAGIIAGSTIFIAGTQIDTKKAPKDELMGANKEIIKTLKKPQKDDGVLYKSTFKLQQIDSVNGQLVVVEKDEPIIVGKDFYNNCRNRGQSKAECIKEIKERIADEIKRSKERTLEEIEMLETQKTDYVDELSEEEKQFIY